MCLIDSKPSLLCRLNILLNLLLNSCQGFFSIIFKYGVYILNHPISWQTIYTIMHKVHTQYTQRWHHLYSQASEQSSNTDVINRQLIVSSDFNVTIISRKQPDDVLMQVDMSDTMVHYKKKGSYTVVIIVTVYNNPRHAFMAVRSKNHVSWNCHH